MVSVDPFGELRSVLQRPPSVRAWQDLCAVCDAWPGGAPDEAAIVYALGHVRRWPDAWRVAPRAWLRAAAAGAPMPQLALAAHAALGLTLEEQDWQWSFDAQRQRGEPIEALMFEALDTLVNHPALHDLRTLQLDEQYTSDRLYDQLQAARALTQLTGLDLRQCYLGDETARRCAPLLKRLTRWAALVDPEPLALLIREEALANLTSLSMRDGALSRSPLLDRAIAQGGLSQLRALDLSDCSLEDPMHYAADYAIGWLHHLPALTELNLCGVSLDEVGVRAMLRCPHAPRWRSLTLDWNSAVGDHALQQLAASPAMSGLTRLSLSMCGFYNDGVEALLRSPHLRALEVLDLSLGDWDGRAVWPADALPALREVRWPYTLGADDEALRLARSPHGAKLTSLWLMSSQDAEATIARRAELFSMGRWLPKLEALHLGEDALDDALLSRSLLGCDLPALRELDLRNNLLTDEAAAIFQRHPALCARLTSLDLRYNRLSDEGRAALRAAPALAHCALWL